MVKSVAPAKPLRQDAARNRGRILEAASGAFAEHGLDVPMEAVAARAGVGIGTLYRRFPVKEELIGACFERRLTEYVEAAEDALKAPDGWTGFRSYVERICAMQAQDRGLKDVLTRTFPRAIGMEATRARGADLFMRVVERAKLEGSLRQDFVAEDHLLLLLGNAGVVQGCGEAAPDAWRRYVGLMLDGLRSTNATPLPAGPTRRQMLKAMLRLSPRPAQKGNLQ